MAVALMGERERWSEVAVRMARYLQASGFSVVEVFTGHGIGREMHEHPKVPNFTNPKVRWDDFPLRAGLVIAVEPMMNMGGKDVQCGPDQWTQVTVDGQPSAHFEHTVALTEDGPEILTGPPSEGEEDLI